MGIGVTLVLVAGGAIRAWVVHTSTSGVDLHLVGVILLVVGVAGCLLSPVFWSSWGGVGGRRKETIGDGRA
jgi:hypothetical protein